ADSRAKLQAWRPADARFVVVGHRGAAGVAPENTFFSFDLAVVQGVDAIECDVHLSADGVPVVIHDPTVDRTTNGHGAVANLILAQLRALDAGGRFGPAVAGARIPTLDELLAWAHGRIRVVVELKGTQNPSLVPRTLDLIRQYDVIED